MSVVSISYSSLKDASNEAKKVAKRLDKYADRLEDKVYKKLNKYKGDHTSNITTAKSKVNGKISDLRSMSGRFETYASNLTGLRDECKDTDKAVKSRVSSLTASFKSSHGIRNSALENGYHRFKTSLTNSTSAGRWVNKQTDKAGAKIDELKSTIKQWYNYEGGKDFLLGSLKALLEIAIGVCGIIVAIASGGALIAIIAGVVLGVIGIANGLTDLINEGRALGQADDDPGKARRRHNLDTLTDTMRVDSDNKIVHGFANGIDIVETVCTFIQLGDGLSKLAKNGLKWVNNSKGSLKELFSKQTFSNLGTKIKGGFTDLGAALKNKDWLKFRDMGKMMWGNFKFNLNSNYNQFIELKEGATTIEKLGKGASSIRNTLSIGKDLLDGGLGKAGFNFALKNITLFTVSKDTPKFSVFGLKGGQIFIDDLNHVKPSDFRTLVTRGEKVWDGISNNIDNWQHMSFDFDLDVIDKMENKSGITVAIPDIHIPKISMPVIPAM